MPSPEESHSIFSPLAVAFEKVIEPALRQNSFIVPSILATQMGCAKVPKEKTVVIIKNKKLNDRLFRRA